MQQSMLHASCSCEFSRLTSCCCTFLPPQQFWSRLAGALGSKFYWQTRGEADTIMDTVNAIGGCWAADDEVLAGRVSTAAAYFSLALLA